MKSNNHIAKAEVSIHAPIEKVWLALTNPALIKKYMFDTTVESDWKEGSDITWKGEFNGKAYEDHGIIESVEPNRHLQYSHTSGSPDGSENGDTHMVDIQLTTVGNETHVALTQDNNADEKAIAESEKNWNMMLSTMKDLLEQN